MFFMSYIVLVSSPKGREELVPQTGSSPQPELGECLGCCDEILKKTTSSGALLFKLHHTVRKLS